MTQAVTSSSVAQSVLAAMYRVVFNNAPMTELNAVSAPPKIYEMVDNIKNILDGWTHGRLPRVLPLNHQDIHKEEVQATLAGQIFFGSALNLNFGNILQECYPHAYQSYIQWCDDCFASGFAFHDDLHALANWAVGNEPNQFGPLIAYKLGIMGDHDQGFGDKQDIMCHGLLIPHIVWMTDLFRLSFEDGSCAVFSTHQGGVTLTWINHKVGTIPPKIQETIDDVISQLNLGEIRTKNHALA